MRSGLVLLLCVLLLAPGDAGGHTRSQSVSQWVVTEQGARVVLRVPLLELTRIPGADVANRPLDEWLGAYAAARLILRADGEVCSVLAPPEVFRPADDRVGVAWAMRCGPGERRIETSVLLDVAPSHLHFAQVHYLGATTERVLSAREPHWDFATAAEHDERASVRRYVWLGLTHIASGLDHLVFLLALLLVERRGRQVLVVVTGFTIGHSVTLALAALEWLQPEVAAVEALIGLSIALVACEGIVTRASARAWGIVWAIGLTLLAGARGFGFGAVPATSLLGLGLFAACHFPLLMRTGHPERVRASVAMFFGLVHGLGFGGFLFEVGLPPGRVATALFGFNLGVEMGQLALVAVAWPVLRLLDRGVWRDAGLSAVTALGFYWFVTRGF